jgi:hypothetical protein
MNIRHIFPLVALFLGLNARAQTLSQTNLPIIIINTNGGTIADTQILSDLKIIDNTTGLNHPGDAPSYQGNIGIKFRGSASNPKRSYNVETWTNIPKTSLDVSLLGMPTENDWVLLACYNDRSLMRNLIGFHLYQQMGYYAPRMRLVEVLLNNNYQGIYLFGEKIKRDVNRLDIANLKITDVSGSALTGGYIFRIDNSNDNYWTSSVAPPYATSGQTIRFHYEEPADNVITSVQQAYIKGYVDSFEANLLSSSFQDTSYGWRKFGAHNSWEDFFLLNEVLKSEDAYRLSTYLYKDKDKKLRVGPPWDLELALYNTANCNASRDTGWAYQHGASCPSDAYLPPFWWDNLVSDTAYMRDVKCKYTHHRNSILDTTTLFGFIDSVATLLNDPQGQPLARNFQKWPIWGVSLINEPAPVSNNYFEEVTKIKAFIKRRLQYLDTKWLTPGCTLGVPAMVNEIAKLSIYPNPASETFTAYVSLKKFADVQLTMRDMMGRIVLDKKYVHLPAGEQSFSYSIQNVPSGIYSVTILTNGLKAGTYKLVKE